MCDAFKSNIGRQPNNDYQVQLCYSSLLFAITQFVYKEISSCGKDLKLLNTVIHVFDLVQVLINVAQLVFVVFFSVSYIVTQ